MNQLNVNHISVLSSTKKILQDISFQACSGSFLGVVGPNGAGKSTLFKSICNIIEPNNGSILFNDQLLSQDQVGYLPEERSLYEDMKVDEQIDFFFQLNKSENQSFKSQLSKWVNVFEIEDLLTKKTKHLSKGQQQKVQLIITLIHEPDLLLLDEPFSGIDIIQAEKLKTVLRKELKDKVVLISSHQMDHLSSVCDEFILINNG